MSNQRKQEVVVDGVKLMVLSRLLEVRPVTGLPAKEYNLIDGEYKIAIPEEVMVAAEELVIKKQTRDEQLDALTVTYMGITYDANERSQSRIASALSSATSSTIIDWKDADNVWVYPTAQQLKAVAKLARIATTIIWRMDDETGN